MPRPDAPCARFSRFAPWVLSLLTAEQLRSIIRGIRRYQAVSNGTNGTGYDEPPRAERPHAHRLVTRSAAFRDELVHALLLAGYTAHASSIRSSSKHQQDALTPPSLAAPDEESWAIDFTDSDDSTSASTAGVTEGRLVCEPQLRLGRDVNPVLAPAADSGGQRAWCVEVDHPDHLVIAQRAWMGPSDDKLSGVVVRQSRPVVVGNSISTAEFRHGLETLGFDMSSASDMVLLHSQLDKEHSGAIKESQFIHAFRSLNRAAIEAKLREGARLAEEARRIDDMASRTKIQLVKIAHKRAEGALSPSSNMHNNDDEDDETDNRGGGRRGSLSSDPSADLNAVFQHVRNIAPVDLAELLRREEEESVHEHPRKKTIRWYDVVGFNNPVLDLLSNAFLLPHEMLGEDVELESQAHMDFYTGRLDPHAVTASAAASRVPPTVEPAMERGQSEVKANNNGAGAGNGAADSFLSPGPMVAPRAGVALADLSEEPSSQHPMIGSVIRHRLSEQLSAEQDEDASSTSSVTGTTSADLAGAGPSATPAPPGQKPRSASAAPVGDVQSNTHSTMKLLIHALHLRNFPLEEPDSDNDDDHSSHIDSTEDLNKPPAKFVSFKQYKKRRPVMRATPVHIVIANAHTLITVRPWTEPAASAAEQQKKGASAAAASPPSCWDPVEPNDQFDDLIASLNDTDPTSRGSVLGLTSALQLLMRVWEDLVDASVRFAVERHAAAQCGAEHVEERAVQWAHDSALGNLRAHNYRALSFDCFVFWFLSRSEIGTCVICSKSGRSL
jgi:hypothetical protein